MASPFPPLLMALFSPPPFSFLPVLLLFFPPLPLLPTSMSPCGGSLKVFSLFSLLLFASMICLVRSLFCSFINEFLHSLVLSRRARRQRMLCMRLQHALHSAKIFLVLMTYHTHGLHVVAAQVRLLLGSWLASLRLDSAWFVLSSSVESVIAPIVSR